MTESEDYPASWYAATRNIHNEYPTLDEHVSADVCVIGGGFSGLSTAIYLAEQGIDVVVLETNRVGWGASGRNGGHLVRGYGENTHDLVTRQIGEEAGKRARQLGYGCLDLVRDIVWLENPFALQGWVMNGKKLLLLKFRVAFQFTDVRFAHPPIFLSDILQPIAYDSCAVCPRYKADNFHPNRSD